VSEVDDCRRSTRRDPRGRIIDEQVRFGRRNSSSTTATRSKPWPGPARAGKPSTREDPDIHGRTGRRARPSHAAPQHRPRRGRPECARAAPVASSFPGTRPKPASVFSCLRPVTAQSLRVADSAHAATPARRGVVPTLTPRFPFRTAGAFSKRCGGGPRARRLVEEGAISWTSAPSQPAGLRCPQSLPKEEFGRLPAGAQGLRD